MSRRGNHDGKKGFALGALIGGLCGGVTALLFASKSGKQLRKDITKKYHKASDQAYGLYEDAKEKSDELVKKARSLVTGAKRSIHKKKRK